MGVVGVTSTHEEQQGQFCTRVWRVKTQGRWYVWTSIQLLSL